MPQNTANPEPAAIQVLRHWDAISEYVGITTSRQLQKLVTQLKQYDIVAVDTETTGVDVITADCLGYSFSVNPHESYWVPIQVDPQLKQLGRLVKKKKDVVFFNAAYDLAIMEKYGVEVDDDAIRDVMIACFFRDIPNYRHNQGLKPQAALLLQCQTVELKELIAANLGKAKIKDDEVDFTALEPWQQRVYGCQDSDITLQLWQLPEIQAATRIMPDTWKLEHKLIRPVMEMYRNGVGINEAKCAELDAILEKECAKCSTDAHKIALNECDTIKDDNDQVVFANAELQRLTKKKGLNLGSFKQKQILLFDELGLPPTRRTTSGYSTDQEALSDLEGKHDVIPIVMRYNKLVSRRNSYTKKLPKLINPATGRIHPSLWATGVKSGRFSCSNPNMQGVSKDHAEDDPAQVREVFVPAKGNMLTAADYSQIELRIAASLSGEPAWCKAYHAGDIDVHTQTASEMYGVPLDKVVSDQRDIAKTANFSILTGISAHTLSARNRKTIPTPDAGQDIIDKWFAALPVLKQWIETTKVRAARQGYMATYFGRIRPFPEIVQPTEERIQQRVSDYRQRWGQDADEYTLRETAIRSITNGFRRKALSHIIQGTAADIMKIAMIRTYRAIKKERMPLQMLLTVHDELLFEHSPDIMDEAHALIRESMEFPCIGKGWVPLPVDIGVGHNWAEAH